RGGRGGRGGGGGNPGPQATAVVPLPDAVEVEFAPPLDKMGNFKHSPKTTWRDVKDIEVKKDTPRGKFIAFSAPPTLAAAAAAATAPAAAPGAVADAAPGGPGGRGGRGGGGPRGWRG